MAGRIYIPKPTGGESVRKFTAVLEDVISKLTSAYGKCYAWDAVDYRHDGRDYTESPVVVVECDLATFPDLVKLAGRVATELGVDRITVKRFQDMKTSYIPPSG